MWRNRLMRWFLPWVFIRQQRETIEDLLWRTSDRDERLKASARELNQLRALGDEQARLIHEAETEAAQLRDALTKPGAGANTPSSQKPDFVLVGIPRPGQGVRVIASRNLTGTHFDMTAFTDPPPRWVIKATMDNALFVDKPSYPEAIAHVGMVWGNWDKHPVVFSDSDWQEPHHGPPARPHGGQEHAPVGARTASLRITPAVGKPVIEGTTERLAIEPAAGTEKGE